MDMTKIHHVQNFSLLSMVGSIKFIASALATEIKTSLVI